MNSTKRLIAATFAVLTLADTCYGASADTGRTAKYWMEHRAERMSKLKECKSNAAIAESTDCANAARAAIAVLGSGTPVYVGAPPKPAAAPALIDQECTRERLLAIQDKEAREEKASNCIRRGTFKPTPKTRAW